MRTLVWKGFSGQTGFNNSSDMRMAEHVMWQNQNVTKMVLHRYHRSK